MNLSFPTEDTIAAIATAVSAGQGGVAIIRISGPLAEKVGQSIVHVSSQHIWASHHILYGHVRDKQTDELIDEVLVLLMKAPRSFTGEDVVEIHCHGGLISVQRVLGLILLHPHVRRALPGEFSERAVINGRIDLTQAEAISDLISARSQKAAKLAITGITGRVNKHITSLREKLIEQLSELEARVDFEDDLPPLNEELLLSEIIDVQQSLETLIEDGKKSSVIRNGLKVVLIGLPNVGKSSLLNRLSKTERSIVTDVPGTTRDLLEIEILLEGVPITLVDSAGIHATEDKIEKLGIERSEQAIMTADAVMLIFDISQGWDENNQKLLNQIPEEMPKIIIGNKSDIQISTPQIEPDVIFSALTGKGEEKLIKALLRICGANDIQGLEIALNERQIDLAILAKAALNRTQKMATEKLPWDFWTIDLREAIHKLGELSGDEITESVLDRIFSKFCIGK
tara:strand:+ start:122 stop:1489 length:1368 start_codon:yes stop_codon:yes gene_type:complete